MTLACFAFTLWAFMLPLQISFADEPTVGCTQQQYGYQIQKPYDIPVDERYSFIDGIHKMWVYSDDKPFKPDSSTKPRTEMQFRGRYSSGVWQFEGDVFVPNGTTGTTIMQIKPLYWHSVTMLKVYDGVLSFKARQTLATNIYNKWLHVNILHDADNHTVSHYINGEMVLKLNVEGEGAPFYVKCGVYTQNNPSHYTESQWTNISVWKC